MAKANLVLPDGTKVNIEGTAEEVAILIARCSQATTTQGSGTKRRRKASGGSKTAVRKSRKGPVAHISALAEEGYFKTRRILPDVQKKLEEHGHIYAQSSLSPALLGLTKKGVLRRLREKKGWAYVRA
jgi:hypothetical protein